MFIENFLIEQLQGKKPTSHPTRHPTRHPTQHPNKPTDPNEKRRQNTKAIILGILNVILASIAGYLCWNCNAGEKPALRVIYTILAAIFSGLYILFYFVYHVLLRVPCSGGGGGTSSGSSSVGDSGSSGSSGSSGDTIFD